MPSVKYTSEQIKQAENLMMAFSECLQDLWVTHGKEATRAAMKKFELFSNSGPSAPINEILGGLGRAAPAVAAGVGNVIKKVSKTGLTLGGLAAALGLKAVDKEYDQDVNIAGITTKEPLNVSSPSLEKLLVQTQQMLQNLTSVLGAGMKELNTSIDYNTAAETGDTLAQIQGAQATGFSAGTGANNPKPKARPPRPQRTSAKEDPEL